MIWLVYLAHLFYQLRVGFKQLQSCNVCLSLGRSLLRVNTMGFTITVETKSLSMPARKFLGCGHQSGKIHPECWQHHLMVLGPGLSKGGSELNTSVHLSLLPDCGCAVTGCLTLLSLCLSLP